MPEPVADQPRPDAPARPSWKTLLEHPAVPYVGPFAVFLLILSVQSYLGALGEWQAPLWFVVLGLVIFALSRRVLDLSMAAPAASVAVGIAVFAVWIAPDLLWPAMREHWLFQNRLVGSAPNPANAALSTSSVFLIFRFLRAVVIVPVAEELFWRGWLMRWLIAADFRSVPLGAYTPRAFWFSAILFAVEHGSYWDVGLAAGIAYNLWVMRTKRLGDCILAHAVTNATLSAYVIWTGQWRYWP